MAPEDGRGNFATQGLRLRLPQRLCRIAPAQQGRVEIAATSLATKSQREVQIGDQIQENVADTLFAGHRKSPHIKPPNQNLVADLDLTLALSGQTCCGDLD